MRNEGAAGQFIYFRRLIAFIFLGVLMPFYPAGAQYRSQGRSMVISRDGIVAAESPLAAQAGATILARGGNAVDAAVATNAVMGVVAPMMDGIGGDLFAIVYEVKTGKLFGLNASGWAPAGISAGLLKSKGFTQMPETGIYSVTVPGAVDGWSKLLEKFGTKKFPDLLSAAIHYARKGFPVPEWDAEEWESAADAVRNDPHAAAVFLPGGHAPHVGEIFKNPDLAHSLESISLGGRDAFYKGEIARRILAESEKLAGTLAAEDLATFSSEWVEPISTTYRAWTVFEIPPNGQGIAALEMLNIMETFPIPQFGRYSADALHVTIEAKKLAYADLYEYVADTKFAQVPAAGMIWKEYASKRAKLIDMAKANCAFAAGDPAFRTAGDTTYLSVVDRAGNMVSLIQSNAPTSARGSLPRVQVLRCKIAGRDFRSIQLRGNYSPDMGGGQAVLRDFSKGVNYGASDPRKDGEAIPEPPSAY